MSGLGEAFTSGWKALVAELTGSAFLVFGGSLAVSSVPELVYGNLPAPRHALFTGSQHGALVRLDRAFGAFGGQTTTRAAACWVPSWATSG